MVYRCIMCTGYVTLSLRELLDHTRRSHSNDPSFHVLCGLDGCPRTYKKFLSFRNHIIRKHSLMLDENKTRLENNEDDIFDEPCAIVDEPNDPAIQTDAEPSLENILQDNARCLLGFKENGRLTQTAVNLFVESSTQMARNSVQVAKTQVKERLAAVGQAIEDIPGLADIFEDNSPAMNPLQGIETEQQQYKFYQNHFNVVVCIYFSSLNLLFI